MTLESSYKKFSLWSLNLINTMVSVIKVWVLSKKPPHLFSERNEKLIVMGTGPSMRASIERNRTYFQHEHLMAVNTFSLSEDYPLFRPRYYVMLDPGLWMGENEWVQNTMHNIAHHTKWPMKLLIPYAAQKTNRIERLLKENKNVEIVYVNYVVFKGFESIAFSYFRKNKAMPQSHNVLVASLFLAINLGYKRVELFGADHNWHEQLAVDENNVVCMKHIHYYENETELKLVPFWKGVHIKETFRMDEIFHSWSKVFAGYHLLKRYAATHNTRIVNRSANSFIDAFDREPFK